LRRIAGEIGNGSFAAPCDITDEASVHVMAERVEAELGGAPDIVVNNAGVFQVAAITEMSMRLFSDVLHTNLVGPFLVVHAFAARMKERRSGHFVSIGSIADRGIFPENGAYAPAKYALRAMHEVLRLELKGSGVRATLISPGPVNTEMWDGITFAGPERIVPDRGMMLASGDVASAVLYAVTQPAVVNIDELRLSHA
jgi:NAD(P)-dependent dehydrogenase (short-subunit alcohol dehydrogenase family)